MHDIHAARASPVTVSPLRYYCTVLLIQSNSGTLCVCRSEGCCSCADPHALDAPAELSARFHGLRGRAGTTGALKELTAVTHAAMHVHGAYAWGLRLGRVHYSTSSPILLNVVTLFLNPPGRPIGPPLLAQSRMRSQ